MFPLSQPWSTMREILPQYDNHRQPQSTMVNSGQPCSTMVECRILTRIVLIWKSTMVKHNQPWSNITLWQGLSWYENQPWLTMLIIMFIVLFCWVYNSLGFSINQLGLLFDWVYNINHAQQWSHVSLWQRSSQYENQPWSTMVNHVYFRVYNIYRRV